MPLPTALQAFQFAYFSRLPSELREAVWEQCLPFRVVDVGSPSCEYQITEEDLDCEEDAPACCAWKLRSPGPWAADSCCPPTISRVCREARRVAMRNGNWLKLSIYIPVWFDPARDVLHLDWTPFSAAWDNVYDPGLIGRLLTSCARSISIKYDLCFCTRVDPPDPSEWVHRQLEQRRSYDLCFGTVIIHVASQAERRAEGTAQNPAVRANREDPIISSGLFGLFGEERVKQISATDPDQLSKFASFHNEHGSPADERATKFFQTRQLLDSEDVEAHMEELRCEWLKQLWEEADRTGGLADVEGGGESVFAPRRIEPYLPDFDDPDWDHPWVRTATRQMPEFRPVYLVRLCTQKCV
ncbi:hypothetical protein BD289DRAFT_444793 [Coniella lustricola]|uniref:2EXR domain-containing protein n=1 Tax=Coniella lustricola TaxID=2025994 RepID=A0A2T2ZVJ2_9PEZI|nr:hypothetical protein BD289DRAFT_444793 [Coniella lustricola]